MDNIGLIKKLARSFSLTTGLEFDDLFQEAALAYLEGLSTFDAKKGKLSTYMWFRIHAHLNDYLKEQEEFKCKRQQVKSHKEALEMKRRYVSSEEIDIDRPISFEHFFESLSEDAQRVATVILETPEVFDSIPPSETIELVAYTLQEKGIKMSHIWCGIRDLRLAFL
jgi:RNA polymerase sigma factor (sigma-70 family)